MSKSSCIAAAFAAAVWVVSPMVSAQEPGTAAGSDAAGSDAAGNDAAGDDTARTNPVSDNTVAARETFQAAATAYQRGDFEAAAHSFEVSHRLVPHPNTAYNAGLAWHSAKQNARAADRFTEAIAMDGLNAQQLADSKKRLAELMPGLGLALVVAPEGTTITIGHVDGRGTPLSIHLRPGSYEVRAKLPDGRVVSESIEIDKPGTEVSVDFMKYAAAETPVPQPDVPPEPPDTRNMGMWVSGWVLTAVGAAAGGAAIGLGVAALSAKDEFDASGSTNRSAHDSADMLRTTTNVMWAAAGVGVVSGVLLLVFSGNASDPPAAGQHRFARQAAKRPEVEIDVAPGLGNIVVTGRF